MDAARKGLASCIESSPKLESLKSKRFLILLDIANIKASIKDLPAIVAGQPDAKAVERARLTEALTEANTTLASIETDISVSEKIIANHKTTLPLPTFGTENEVDNQRLRLQVPLFDPILDNPTIDDFWKKLIDYGEGLHWGEEGFKKALSNLLQQEAYKLYYIMRKKPLKDILTALQGSYYNYETVLDLRKKLDAATRQPNQSITNFMNSVHSLLYQTSTLRPGNEAETKAVEREILRQKLIKNASEYAQNAIFRAQKKALKAGVQLTFEECLEIAKEAEHEENQN